MKHPFLSVPENERVYQLLCDCPTGTTRSWATKAGWTQAKIARFLKRLVELGVAEVHSFGKSGSVFKPIDRVDVSRSESMRVDLSRSESAYLGSKASRSTASRYEESKERKKTPRIPTDSENPTDHERLCIRTVNEVMVYRFGEMFSPISEDNFGSIVAVRQMAGASVPPERQLALLRSQGMTFTPDKTGGGLPRSLGHGWFAKSVIKTFRIERRMAADEEKKAAEEAAAAAKLQQLELMMPGIQLHAEEEPAPPRNPELMKSVLTQFRAVMDGATPPPQRQEA